MAETNFEEDMKKGMEIPCPACTEPMNMAAQRCPNCQKDFTKDEVRKNISSKGNKSRIGCLAMGFLGAVIIYGAYTMLSGSNDAAPTNSPPTGELSFEDEFTWQEVARQMVGEHLRDPGSAEYSDMTVNPTQDGSGTVICGRVNSRNGFGGMTGPQRYIAGGTVMLEEQFTAEKMQTAWDKFCL